MTKTATPNTAEQAARLVPALPRVLLRMPDLAASPKPSSAPLAVEADIDQQPLIDDAPAVDPPKSTHRVDAAHAPRAPHASHRSTSPRPALGKKPMPSGTDPTSPVQRKPLYDGAEGRRQRMKAVKAPVWRTRLFLAMIAAVLLWGTLQISSGQRGKNPLPAAGADEAPPFETDIQLGELGTAPGFSPAGGGSGLDQHSHDEHVHLEKLMPAATAAVDIAPPLQSSGRTNPGGGFAPFEEPIAQDAGSYRNPQVSGRPANGQASGGRTQPISSADLLGGSDHSSPEYIATRPQEANRGSSPAGSVYNSTGANMPTGNNPTQTRYGATLPADSRSDTDADWWKDEPRGPAAGSSSPADAPRFEGARNQEMAPGAAQLGMPVALESGGNDGGYGQSSQTSFDPFGGTAPAPKETYFAPGDPAANRPAQARLNENFEPTTDSRFR